MNSAKIGVTTKISYKNHFMKSLWEKQKISNLQMDRTDFKEDNVDNEACHSKLYPPTCKEKN